jgi:hypothetical protein
MKLVWEAVIVFNGVGRAHNLRAFKADNGMDHLYLYVFWKTGRGAVDIEFVGRAALWFQKDLVALFLSKFDELVFD